MAKNFIARNWRTLAVLLGIALARELLQRRKFIQLQQKTVIITGGSRGLGLALAEEFAREGANLVLCARDAEELTQAQSKLSSYSVEILTVPCDVSQPEQAQQLIAQATTRFGSVDVLVNNAGIISVGSWQTLTREDFEESMNTMFWGIYNTTMAVLPQMVERHNGRIVNITSIGGKVSVPHLLPYASAKFAAVGFSEGLHAELAQEGVIVTTVAPGLMRTGSTVNTTIKGEKHRQEYTWFTLLDTLPLISISAQTAARQIVNATKRGETELLISLSAQIMARVHGAFPALFTDLLAFSDRFLPHNTGKMRYSGGESETPITQSPLTITGQKASQQYNENSD